MAVELDITIHLKARIEDQENDPRFAPLFTVAMQRERRLPLVRAGVRQRLYEILLDSLKRPDMQKELGWLDDNNSYTVTDFFDLTITELGPVTVTEDQED